MYVAREREKIWLWFLFADDPVEAYASMAGLGLFPTEDIHNLAAV